MKYNIIGKNNYLSDDIVLEILNNRGIDESIFDYCKNSLPNPFEFKMMKEACECISNHIENKGRFVIINDSDPDGATSTAIIHNYIKKHDAEANIQIAIHEKRVHGIFLEELEGLEYDILIVPDAGSDNYEEHEILSNKGIDVVILDHHDVKKRSKNAIVVNNNIDNKYTNLSGAGMSYLLCKALDEELWSDYADEFIDLAMLGCISDMMNIGSNYMQYIVQKGFENINNKFLKSLIESQDYSLNGKLNPIGISFYITPLINSVYRLGSMELKRNMINAFCELDDNTYIYTPNRGKRKGEEIEETIYEKTSRECKSINEKRKRIGKKAIKESIDYECKINFVEIKEEYGEKGLARIVANNLSRKKMKPTIVYYKNKNGELKGSMSSGDLVENFKDKLNSTDIFHFVAGHQDASGFQIKNEMIKKATETFDKLFKDEKFEKIYNVDFIIDFEEFVSISNSMAKDICEYLHMFGKGIESPLLLVKNIKIPSGKVELMGSSKNTIKYGLSETFSAIQFGTSQDFFDEMIAWNDFVEINIIGEFSSNEYNDKIYYQLKVIDVEILNNENDDMEEDIDDGWEW